MRTTLTIDDQIAADLKQLAHESGRSFQEGRPRTPSRPEPTGEGDQDTTRDWRRPVYGIVTLEWVHVA